MQATEIKEKIREIDALHREIEKLKEELAQSQGDTNRQVGFVSKLRAEIEQLKDDMTSQNATLTASLATLKSQDTASKGEILRLESSMQEESERSRQTAESHRRAMAEKTREIDSLKSEAERLKLMGKLSLSLFFRSCEIFVFVDIFFFFPLENAAVTSGMQATEIKQKVREIDSLHKKIEKLEEELMQSQGDTNRQAGFVNKLRAEIEQLKTKITSTEDSLAENMKRMKVEHSTETEKLMKRAIQAEKESEQRGAAVTEQKEMLRKKDGEIQRLRFNYGELTKGSSPDPKGVFSRRSSSSMMLEDPSLLSENGFTIHVSEHKKVLDDIGQAKKRVQELEAKLETQTKQAQDKHAADADLTLRKLTQALEEKGRLDRDLEHSQSLRAQLAAELESLKRQGGITESLHAAKENMAVSLATKETTISQLGRDVEAKRAQITELSHQVRETDATRERLAVDLASTQAFLKAEKEKTSQLAADLQRLERAHQECSTLTANTETTKEELRKAGARIRDLEQQLGKYQQPRESVFDFQAEGSVAMKQKIDSLTREKNAFYDQARLLQTEKDELEKKYCFLERVSLGRAQQEVHDARLRHQELQAQFDEVSRNLRDSHAKIARLRQELEQTKEDYESQRKYIADLKTEKGATIAKDLKLENRAVSFFLSFFLFFFFFFF